MIRKTLALLVWFALCIPSHALLLRGRSVIVGNNSPINTAIPAIVGLDFPPSVGGNVTFTLSPASTTAASWDNFPISYTQNWHCAGGPSLGTGASLTLNTSSPGVLGCVLEVDLTASNLFGSFTARSHWIGPIESTAPVMADTTTGLCPGGGAYCVPMYELQTSPPQQLPSEPAHFLQNGFAIYPGCVIPPVAPTHTASGDPNVWYFAPTGQTYAQWITSGTPNPGHTKATALLDPNALLNTVGATTAGSFVNGTAYTITSVGTTNFTLIGAASNTVGVSFVATGVGSGTGTAAGYPSNKGMFGAVAANPNGVIRPGDTIYIEHGYSTAQGIIKFEGGAIVPTPYSTSDGTSAGSPIWTWVLADPTDTQVGALSDLNLSGGSNTGMAYWIFSINIENYRPANLNTAGGQTGVIQLSGTYVGANTFTHDVIFDHMSLTQWSGHSNDARNASIYPNAGGLSDGTIVTSSPVQAGRLQNQQSMTVTAGNNATQLAITKIPFLDDTNPSASVAFGAYVWAPGIYSGTPSVVTTASGIPSGTVIELVNGLDNNHFAWSNGTVTGAVPSDITALVSGGSTQTSIFTLPTIEDDTVYWQVAATTATNASVYTWNKNVGTINFPANPAVGTNIVINGVTWTFVASGATGNQINLGASLTATLANLKAGLDTSIAAYTTSATGIIATWTATGANLAVSGGTSGGVGYAWTSIGTVLAVAPTTPDLILTTTFNNHVWHWCAATGGTCTTAPIWQDQGAPNVTIAPCDQVSYAGKGCPGNYPGQSFVVPQCDPKYSPIGTSGNLGGCIGTPTAWTGTTRVISNEAATLTSSLVVVPANYWNWNDWDGNTKSLITVHGAINTACPPNVSAPGTIYDACSTGAPAQYVNNFQGISCISISNSTFRESYNAVNISNTTDSIIYNNFIKYLSDDAFEPYSDNRIIIAHNHYTDPTFIYGHQDFIQFGDTNGRGETALTTSMLYQSAVIENTAIQYSDPNNWFPRQLQGVNNTENSFYATYVADNILGAATGIANILITGHYNALVHNVGMGNQGGSVGLGIAKKGCSPGGPALVCTAPFAPSLVGPIDGLLANNVGIAIQRMAQFIPPPGMTNFCDPSSGDLSTVEGNIGLPFPLTAGPSVVSSTFCATGNSAQTGSLTGHYDDLNIWTATDWRSSQSGISPLFTYYNPANNPVSPAIGWQSEPVPTPFVMTCIQDSWAYGTCPNAVGTANFRPNPAFAGFAGSVTVSLQPGQSTGKAFNLPTTGISVGNFGNVTTDGFNGHDYPVGLWEYCPSVVDPTTGCDHTLWTLANGWGYVGATTPYNPGIIGAGTPLTSWFSGGPQPLVDLDGNLWKSTPDAGAYQSP
jgi:hypothetical protein